MNAIVQLLTTISRHLRREGIAHAVIGGITVAFWGRPRATEDIDLLVDIRAEDLPALAEYCSDHDIEFDMATASALLAEGKPFPLEDTWSIHWIDVRPAVRPHDGPILERAVKVLLDDEEVPVATPEDTILAKLSAGRDQDLADARSIVLRQGKALDADYVEAQAKRQGLIDRWQAISRAAATKRSS